MRSVLLSGGSIDARRPDYNEALRGREHMLGLYGAAFGGREALAARILVDPLAHHSTTNLRNAARLCTDLGLDRALIATTMPPNPWLWPAGLPVAYQTNQGWYFLHQHVSTFAWRCRRALGYTLGEFAWFETRVAGERVTAIAHTDLPRERLLRDEYGP